MRCSDIVARNNSEDVAIKEEDDINGDSKIIERREKKCCCRRKRALRLKVVLSVAHHGTEQQYVLYRTTDPQPCDRTKNTVLYCTVRNT